MKKIEYTKLNRSNSDIWQMIKMGLDTNNKALLESSLSRLKALQKYYLDLLNFQDMEINQYKDLLSQETAIRESFEKEWLEETAKKTNSYERLKQRIEATYKHL
jgi:hypothetical protein